MAIIDIDENLIEYDDVPDAADWLWLMGLHSSGLHEICPILNNHPDFQIGLTSFLLGYVRLMIQPEIVRESWPNVFNSLILKEVMCADRWKASTLRAVMEAIRLNANGQPKILGDGSCYYRYWMPFIQRVFPNSHMLVVYRSNIWDMLASHWFWQSQAVPETNIPDQVLLFMSEICDMLNLRRMYPNNFRSLCVDELVVDPEMALTKFYTPLGLPVESYEYDKLVLPVLGYGIWEKCQPLAELRDCLQRGDRPGWLCEEFADMLRQDKLEL